MRVLSYKHIKPKEIFCKHCGAELEYLYTDVKTKLDKTYIVCPVCGRTLFVPPFVINWGNINKEG